MSCANLFVDQGGKQNQQFATDKCAVLEMSFLSQRILEESQLQNSYLISDNSSLKKTIKNPNFSIHTVGSKEIGKDSDDVYDQFYDARSDSSISEEDNKNNCNSKTDKVPIQSNGHSESTSQCIKYDRNLCSSTTTTNPSTDWQLVNVVNGKKLRTKFLNCIPVPSTKNLDVIKKSMDEMVNIKTLSTNSLTGLFSNLIISNYDAVRNGIYITPDPVCIHLPSNPIIGDSSKQIVPVNKCSSCLSLYFDTRPYFKKYSVFRKKMEKCAPQKKKGKCHYLNSKIPLWNFPEAKCSEKNSSKLVNFKPSPNRNLGVFDEKRSKCIKDDIKDELMSLHETKNKLYLRKVPDSLREIADNYCHDSTDSENSLEECISELKVVDLKSEPERDIQRPANTSESTFSKHDFASKTCNEMKTTTKINNCDKSDGDCGTSNLEADSFLARHPIALEFLDYDTEKVDAMIVYPLEHLESIKLRHPGELTKEKVVQYLLKNSKFCGKPMGIIAGVKETLSNVKNKDIPVAEPTSSVMEQTIHCNTLLKCLRDGTIQKNDKENRNVIEQILKPPDRQTQKEYPFNDRLRTPSNLQVERSKIPRSTCNRTRLSDQKSPLRRSCSVIAPKTNLQVAQRNFCSDLTFTKMPVPERKMISFRETAFITPPRNLPKKKVSVEEIIASDFKKYFRSFAKIGNHAKLGSVISKANSNYWLKKTGVIGDDETTKIADHFFNEIAGRKLVLNIYDYVQYLLVFSRSKRMFLSEVVAQLKCVNLANIAQLKRIPSTEDTKINTDDRNSTFIVSGNARPQKSILSKISLSSTTVKNSRK